MFGPYVGAVLQTQKYESLLGKISGFQAPNFCPNNVQEVPSRMHKTSFSIARFPVSADLLLKFLFYFVFVKTNYLQTGFL